MFNRISTLAAAAVLAVSIAAPAFAQSTPSAMSSPPAMKHGSMAHGSMKHGSMAHGSMKHGSMKHGSMKHGSMKHETKTPPAA